jgi:AraC-like DNA-binding protein
MPLDSTLLPVERLLHRGALAMIGEWRCAPDAAWFRDSGPIRNHVFVFPRSAVRIVRTGGEAVAADPGVVMLYNRGDEYRREALSPRGDRCDWFSVAPEVLDEAVHAVPGADGANRPFPISHAFTSNAVFFRQRRLAAALRGGHPPTSLQVDEAAVGILDVLVTHLLLAPPEPVAARHIALVDRARAILAATLTRRLGLAQLAEACGVSPWFLVRVFKRVTGTTIHDYRERLRLRASLGPVAAGRDLSSIALDLGFAAHSHFTQAFRRAFGVTPSRFRQDARASDVIATSRLDPPVPPAAPE